MSYFFDPQGREADLPCENAVVVPEEDPELVPYDPYTHYFAPDYPVTYLDPSFTFVPADQSVLIYQVPITKILGDNTVGDLLSNLGQVVS